MEYVRRLWGGAGKLRPVSLPAAAPSPPVQPMKAWCSEAGNEADHMAWSALCFSGWPARAPPPVPAFVSASNVAPSVLALRSALYAAEASAAAFPRLWARREEKAAGGLLAYVKSLLAVRRDTALEFPPPPPPAPTSGDVEKDKARDEMVGVRVEMERARALVDDIFRVAKGVKGLEER